MMEYAILVTDRRSIFIQQEQTRAGFYAENRDSLRLLGNTNARPKTLLDYSDSALGSLALDDRNIAIEHKNMTKLTIGVGGLVPVFYFDLTYKEDDKGLSLVFYAVPLANYVAEPS